MNLTDLVEEIIRGVVCGGCGRGVLIGHADAAPGSYRAAVAASAHCGVASGGSIWICAAVSVGERGGRGGHGARAALRHCDQLERPR